MKYMESWPCGDDDEGLIIIRTADETRRWSPMLRRALRSARAGLDGCGARSKMMRSVTLHLSKSNGVNCAAIRAWHRAGRIRFFRFYGRHGWMGDRARARAESIIQLAALLCGLRIENWHRCTFVRGTLFYRGLPVWGYVGGGLSG